MMIWSVHWGGKSIVGRAFYSLQFAAWPGSFDEGVNIFSLGERVKMKMASSKF